MEKLSPRRLFKRLADERVPHSATLELSYGCNLRCGHCFNPTHAAGPRELSFEELSRLLDEMSALGVLDLCLTGGEPTLRPDLFRVLGRALSLGMRVSMNTNAALVTEASARRLEASGIHEVYVSIYGTTAETYETLTGRPGSFAAFEAGLAALAATRLKLVLQMPLTTVNAREHAAARALAERLGKRFFATLDIYPRQDGDRAPLRYRLTPAQKARAVAEGAAPRRCAADGAGFVDCECGRGHFAVTPYGELNLCTVFPTPRYDLRRGSLRDGWEVLKRLVDEARPGETYECPSCELRPSCRQGRADAWLETGDMSACLPHYKELAALEGALGGER